MIQSSVIVAATCSGVAMNRNLIKPEEFTSILIEEAGKVLESDCLFTFSKNLKRLVLIGDDLQMRSLLFDERLKNYSEYDQSLMTRLKRLGISPIQLDEQTRATSKVSI